MTWVSSILSLAPRTVETYYLCDPQILALKAPGSDEDMDTVAGGTGGVVETTESDSADIIEAILEASAGPR